MEVEQIIFGERSIWFSELFHLLPGLHKIHRFHMIL